MSSRDAVFLQQRMMVNWDGRPLDELGLVRIYNETGGCPPLMWIFNAAAEPQMLANALGPDQPLIFTRSTHLLVCPEDDPADIRRPLAEHLTETLKRHAPRTRLDIGANCQGVSLVVDLCALLPKIGIQVGRLSLINCRLPDGVTGCPALLLYGDEDPGHDPFCNDPDDARQRAKTLFSSHTRQVLRARHGQYFSEAVLKEWIPKLNAFRCLPASAA